MNGSDSRDETTIHATLGSAYETFHELHDSHSYCDGLLTTYVGGVTWSSICDGAICWFRSTESARNVDLAMPDAVSELQRLSEISHLHSLPTRWQEASRLRRPSHPHCPCQCPTGQRLLQLRPASSAIS